MPGATFTARVPCPRCQELVPCVVEIRDGEIVEVYPETGEHPHALEHLDWTTYYLAALYADIDTAWERLGERPEEHYHIDGEGRRRQD